MSNEEKHCLQYTECPAGVYNQYIELLQAYEEVTVATNQPTNQPTF
jgi:hypothetical protein